MSLALGMAACSGSSEGAAPSATTTQPAPAAPTTRPAPTIDLSTPIPGGSLHGTPRPPLENTGDDYVAITKSLVANFRWLTENPDLGAISEIWVPGTDDHDARISAYQFLLDNGFRWADEQYQLLSAEVVDILPGLASLRVVDRMTVERLVDGAGSPIGNVRPREPDVKTSLLLLAFDESGGWRIADWTFSGDEAVGV